MEGKYISFRVRQVATKTKTTVVDGEKVDQVIASKVVHVAVSKYSNEGLGTIDWDESWHCYAFYPDEYTVYDATCMREIADFCESETVLRNIHKQIN